MRNGETSRLLDIKNIRAGGGVFSSLASRLRPAIDSDGEMSLL